MCWASPCAQRIVETARRATRAQFAPPSVRDATREPRVARSLLSRCVMNSTLDATLTDAVVRAHAARALDALVATLGAAAGAPGTDAIAAALARHRAALAALRALAGFETQHYARRVVARDARFEVLVIGWLPGQQSSVHDHAGASGGVLVLEGALTETRFARRDDGLVELAARERFAPGAVVACDGAGVHRVANLEPREALVTLHVYAPSLIAAREYRVAAPGADGARG